MITAKGYSKDLSIQPEGIAITFGREMMNDQGGPLKFLRYFEECINDPDGWWMHKMSNRPKIQVADVYIIVLGRLWGRVKFGWHEQDETIGGTADGQDKVITWRRITLIGPFERCPHKRKLKGFQGFRYTTKLF